MTELWEKLFVMGISTFAFTVAHELGHFLTALILGLNPKLVYGASTDSLFNLAFGVQYVDATLLQSFLVLMGATVLPLIALGIIFLFYKQKKSENLVIAAEVFLVLMIFAFLPMPNVPSADGSRIWAAVLSGA